MRFYIWEDINLAFENQYQEFIYVRTYSRYLDKEKRRETWEETIDRYRDFFIDRIPEQKVQDFFDVCNAVKETKVMPSMRALWTAGPALKRDNIAGFNCSYTTIDSVKSFAEILYILMCGTGVGFSVERQYVSKLPSVPELNGSDSVVIVKDSKRGWAEGFYAVLRSLYAGEIPKWDVSKVRPKGSRLKVFGGRASGPEPLVDLFKFTIAIFKDAQGRKLSSLECHDIATKVASVVVVGGVRRSACISLSNLSDDRMAHCKDGQFWNQNPQRALANNSVAYTEKPSSDRFLEEWLSLIRSHCGERGIFNRESAKFIASLNGRRDVNKEFGTNPCCFTGDMELLTSDGYRRFDDLVGSKFNIVNSDGDLTAGTVWEVGEKNVVEVAFESKLNKKPIVCTDDHIFQLNDGTECMAKDLSGKRLMPYYKNNIVHNARSVKAGFIFGDGYINRLKSDEHLGLEVYIGQDDYDIADLFGCNIGVLYSKEAREIAEEYGMKPNTSNAKTLSGVKVDNSFLRGLYSANGSVICGKYGRVAYKTVSSVLASQVVGELSNIGIESYITTNKKHNVIHKNGEYESKESYDVNICRYSSLIKFASEVGFEQKYKNDNLYSMIVNRSPYVRTVRKCGVKKVYDFNEPKTSWGVVEGVVVHNSEIILQPKEFCNLTEIVVRENDTIESLKEKARHAAILGCVQSTLTDYGFIGREWKRNSEEERLLGVSMTGLCDHPVLGYKSIEAELMLRELKQVVLSTAKEWSNVLGINMPAATTCVKPSGTVSQLVDCASGLHPRYSPFYIRRVRVSTSDPICQFLVDRGVQYDPEVGEALEDASTYVFAFPCKSPESAVMRDEQCAMKQLEYWKMLQTCWCEHKPSITVYVKDEEWLEVGSWVYKNWNYVSGISFLPYDGGVYPLSPYEEIDEEEYNKMVESMPVLDFSELTEYEKEDQTVGSREFACTGGSCELI